MTRPASKTSVLVECALMIALGTILGFIPVFELPHGGSITLVSTLPIVLVSFRHGVKWGTLTAFIHSLIQLLLGVKNLAYCQTTGAVVGCILLDYVAAFTLLGLACVVAKPFKNRLLGVGAGTLAVSLVRYLCSFLSGYIVWKDYGYAFEWMTQFGWGQSISSLGENALCWLYSAVYNATYMLPEAVLTVLAAVILCRLAPRLFQPQA